MKHDIIILTLTKDQRFFDMTMNCIVSLQQSEAADNFNIIVVESNALSADLYKGIATVITPPPPFNFNGYALQGIKQGSAEWVSIVNNDIIFQPGWASACYNYNAEHPEVPSFGHWNDHCDWHPKRFPDQQPVYHGYVVGHHVTGWGITAKRTVFEQINLLSPVEFWFSDNVYSDQLQHHSIQHAILRDSKIIHLESGTARSGHPEVRTYDYYDQLNKYQQRNN